MLGLDTGNPAADAEAEMWIMALIGEPAGGQQEEGDYLRNPSCCHTCRLPQPLPWLQVSYFSVLIAYEFLILLVVVQYVLYICRRKRSDGSDEEAETTLAVLRREGELETFIKSTK